MRDLNFFETYLCSLNGVMTDTIVQNIKEGEEW